MSWAVWCGDGNRWEWGLTKEKADYELAVADAECDCGYPHRIGAHDRNPFREQQRRAYRCSRCHETGHTSRSCTEAS